MRLLGQLRYCWYFSIPMCSKYCYCLEFGRIIHSIFEPSNSWFSTPFDRMLQWTHSAVSYALVTGGTRGIGRAVAERLLSDGAAVAICGRSQASVDRAVAEMASLGRIFGTVADISRLEDVRALFAATDREFGGLDILVNNAGQGLFRKVGEMTPEEWHRNIDLNLNGAFYCAHEALARFVPRGGGFIVNISSLAARNRLQRRRWIQRIEIRPERIYRSPDARSPP